MRKWMKTALSGAAVMLLLTVPALAGETLDLTEISSASGTNYTWKNSVLTLKDGFALDTAYEDESGYADGIKILPGTTVVVEGKAVINAYDCIDVSDIEEKYTESVTIQLKKGAELILNAADNGIDSYAATTSITGEKDGNCKLIIDAPCDEGIWGNGNIVINNCNVEIISEEECIYADTDISIKNCILNLETEDDDDGEGIYSSDGKIIIDSSDIIISADDECLQAVDDIVITDSTLDLKSDDEEGINSETGISIENSKVKIHCDEDPIDGNTYVTITDSSLDLTSDDGYAMVDVGEDAYESSLILDRKFHLYDKDGNCLTDSPIEYSIELINFEDSENWYYNNKQAYRLVTVEEDTATKYTSIGQVFGSLRTVSFSGEGTAVLDDLLRAYGSAISLKKFVPEAREGYEFTGWYMDAACTKPVTRLVITGDMEIFAGWQLIEEETEETAAE